MIRIGVVGCGYWSPNLVRNFMAHPEVSLECCCDINPLQLKRFRRLFPGLRLTAELDDILKDDKIDAIAIATPLATHYPIARRALQAGKHVLVEKPLSHSIRTSHELVGLARKRQLVLMVGHTYLYSPPILKLKDMISSKAIGNLHYVESTRMHFGHFKPKENAVWDLAAHDLSIILFWLKKTECKVYCLGTDCLGRGHIDTAYLNIVFKGGPDVYIFVSWMAPAKVRHMILAGSQKMVFLDDKAKHEKIKIYDQAAIIKKSESLKERRFTYRSGKISSPHLETYEPLMAEIQDFVRCIKSGKNPKSDGLFGLKVVKLLEAADRSRKSRKGITVKIGGRNDF